MSHEIQLAVFFNGMFVSLSSNYLHYGLATVSLYLAKKLGFVLFCIEGCCSRDCRLCVLGVMRLCDFGPK
jgi:hypothetical protein